jgi:hypothetical protein
VVGGQGTTGDTHSGGWSGGSDYNSHGLGAEDALAGSGGGMTWFAHRLAGPGIHIVPLVVAGGGGGAGVLHPGGTPDPEIFRWNPPLEADPDSNELGGRRKQAEGGEGLPGGLGGSASVGTVGPVPSYPFGGVRQLTGPKEYVDPAFGGPGVQASNVTGNGSLTISWHLGGEFPRWVIEGVPGVVGMGLPRL